MDITYDPVKRLINLRKHSVDFVDIDETFFSDPYAQSTEDHGHDEQRWVAVGTTGLGDLLVVVYTYPDNAEIRVISARRADSSERRQYEEKR
jgi:uncharacterized protein